MNCYDLSGKVAFITAGGGAICGEIASALAAEGVRVAVCDISIEAARARAELITSSGGEAIALSCDATERTSVSEAVEAVMERYDIIDILINGAGGGRKDCTTASDLEFFDIEPDALARTMALNYTSAVIPSQVMGRIFAQKGKGVILNISSIAGICPLTRAIGYSNGKAATNSFTQWLAVHMAQNYSPEIRVNAIAPGFMLTEQNRFLLVDEATGEMTERGRQIISSVPMARYGKPEEIVGAALWLVSDRSSFVTGAVIPVDGGFTAFSGV
ncbi:MAG: SDR family oxidoreductase [Armatimonadetes bacterium]|nr:SDR family oxidoreductase [Armatimonadota bacterium]